VKSHRQFCSSEVNECLVTINSIIGVLEHLSEFISSDKYTEGGGKSIAKASALSIYKLAAQLVTNVRSLNRCSTINGVKHG